MASFYPGQGVTIFVDYDVTLDAPPSYEITRDSDGAFVLEGTGTQDTSQLRRWSSAIVFPDDMPPGQYSITWSASSQGQSLQQIERIDVVSNESEYVEIDRLFDDKTPISDGLFVEGDDAISDVTVKVCSIEGKTLLTAYDVSAQTHDGSRFYRADFSSTLPPGPSAFACYVTVWTFNRNGCADKEYHFLYVANYKVLGYVNELRRMIDKAQLQHKNPALRWNDVDLVAFINLGLQRINVSPPTQTGYTLLNIPDNLMYYVLYAAAIEALNSRYMAEAEASFSFNGQPVSLEVDRTGAIESALSHYTTALEDLKTVKKGIIMATGGGGPGSGAGILVLSASPSLDLITYRGEGYTTFRPGSRAIFYDSILSNL